jgi:hypothetical protein
VNSTELGSEVAGEVVGVAVRGERRIVGEEALLQFEHFSIFIS